MAHAHHSEDRDGVPRGEPDEVVGSLDPHDQHRLAVFLAEARPNSTDETAELTIASDLNYLALFAPEDAPRDEGTVEDRDWASVFATEAELARAPTAPAGDRRAAPRWLRTVAPIAAVLLLGTVAGVWGARDAGAPPTDVAMESPPTPAQQPPDARGAAWDGSAGDRQQPTVAPAIATAPEAERSESAASGEAVVARPSTEAPETVASAADRAAPVEASPPALLSGVGALRMADVRSAAPVPTGMPARAALEPPRPANDMAPPSGGAGESAVGVKVPDVASAPAVPRAAVDAGVAAAEVEVRQAIRSYQAAYADMDVSATAEVWPSVDRRSLTRAFGALRSQGVTFQQCDIAVSGPSATAKCRGTLQVVRKVGSALPLTSEHEWVFTMRRVGDDWKIDDVAALQISTAPQV